MAYMDGQRVYEYTQLPDGDFRLRIWEDGILFWDEIIPRENEERE